MTLTLDTSAAVQKTAEALKPSRGGSILVVDFHRDGNSRSYRTFGWSAQEPSHIWSVQGQCGLVLPRPIGDHPVILDLDISTCKYKDIITGSLVRISANGRRVAAAHVRGRALLRCRIPFDAFADAERLDLRFDHPCFMRPNMLPGEQDDRALGLCFYSVAVYPPWMAADMGRFGSHPPGRVMQDATPWRDEAWPDSVPEQAAYRFGPSDAGRQFLTGGWRHDVDGNAWADSRVASIRLPLLETEAPLYARIAFCPLFVRSMHTTQRLSIALNGCVLGQYKTGTETNILVALPREVYEGQDCLNFQFILPDGLAMHHLDHSETPYFFSLVIDGIDIMPLPLEHFEALQLRDDDVSVPRPVAVSECFLDETCEDLPDAIKAALDVELSDLLKNFESIGDNCSFGLAQRKGGAEVFGLLRFANTPLLNLMKGLEDEFSAVTDRSELRLARYTDENSEICLYVDRYGIRWHTEVVGHRDDEETIFKQQFMRLTYLRRKFYETLRGGRKMITVSRADPAVHEHVYTHANESPLWEEKSVPLRYGEILPLFMKLNTYGRNTLLFLTRCAHGRRPGTVELLAPGIMRGYVDDFVISANVNERDHVTWMRVVINAWLLDQGPNASFRQKDSP